MNLTLESAIRSHPFFHGMKPEHLAVLTEGATLAEYRSGDRLFTEGEPANCFFLVQSGSIALEAHEPADGTVLVECVTEGGVIGWSWLFPPFTWHLRARALTPATVVVLDGAHLLGRAESDHEFGYQLMKRASQVLIHRLQSARNHLLEAEIQTALTH